MILPMTIKIYLFFLVVLVTFSACAQKKNNALSTTSDSTLIANRQVLKDLFLCKCIDKGLRESKILQNDHSASVLVEIAEYRSEVLLSVDSLASAVATRIPVSNLTGKRGILLNCIEYYNGKQLKAFITRMDDKIEKASR
jgi:hypothetical protein